jgi:hypothetical protein
MDEVSRCEGRTVLFVSHNMGVIGKLCSTAIWLDRGSIRQYGDTESVIRGYLSQGELTRDRIVELDKFRRPYNGGNELHLTSIEWLCDLPLRHGEKAEVRILFETRAPVPNVAVVIAFCDPGGNQLLSYDSDLPDGYRPNLPRAGMYAVDVEIDALPLHPDTYRLDLLCCTRDAPGGTFDFVPAAVQIEVMAGPTTLDFLTQAHWPSVHLNSKWKWISEDRLGSRSNEILPSPQERPGADTPVA